MKSLDIKKNLKRRCVQIIITLEVNDNLLQVVLLESHLNLRKLVPFLHLRKLVLGKLLHHLRRELIHLKLALPRMVDQKKLVLPKCTCQKLLVAIPVDLRK